MVEKDYGGFGRIPLDSLDKYEILPAKHREKRAIPTSASKLL
jgi:hypothetical protein